jgi:serine/threonine protein kinase
MGPERWQKIQAIYRAALQRSEAERHAFVVEACGDDEDLRNEVKSLLAADVKAQSFLEVSAVEVEARSIAAQTPASLVGRQLGRYKILAPIDSGGMGEVYRARDLSLNRSVAIKVLPQHLAQDSEGRARFLREAKAVAALSHPNVLAIHDFGTEQGVWFAVTELLEGETLRARIQRSPLLWQDAAAIGAAVADGLAAVHGSGLVHRDLKPENIYLTAGGGVKILDFGIARMNRAPLGEMAEETETAYTTPGTVLGTVGYMSPEQLAGRPADAPSDIFSLGCVLHEALTGETPFARATTAETLAAILRDDPPALAETNRDIPPELDRLIRRCLDKQPEKRFSNAQDLSLGLREIVNAPPTRQHRVAAVSSRRSVLLATALIVVLALSGFWEWRQSGVENAIDSLAILPLVNDSGDPALEYLSDGITESLINSLSRLRDLKVSARTTVFHFKGKEVDLAAIEKQLGVRAVVTGRMILKGDDLTIQADLVDVADGSQLWGERYQRKLSELQAVEQEIARRFRRHSPFRRRARAGSRGAPENARDGPGLRLRPLPSQPCFVGHREA